MLHPCQLYSISKLYREGVSALRVMEALWICSTRQRTQFMGLVVIGNLNIDNFLFLLAWCRISCAFCSFIYFYMIGKSLHLDTLFSDIWYHINMWYYCHHQLGHFISLVKHHTYLGYLTVHTMYYNKGIWPQYRFILVYNDFVIVGRNVD